jgi:RNA polymerase sigma factor (sigma-70 family)
MTPEEYFNEYSRLSKAMIHKMFSDPWGVARKNRIEIDDLYQYAATGLWKACLTYQPEKSAKFTSHAFANIRFHVLERLRRETSLIRYSINKDYDENEKHGIVSIDSEIREDSSDHNTYHDIIPSDVDVENSAVGNLNIEHTLSKLTNKQRKVVELKIKGLGRNDISRILNTSGEDVRSKILRAKDRLEKLERGETVSKNRREGRKVSIDGMVFERIADACKDLNLNSNTVVSRLRSNSDRFKEWYYIA